MSLRHPGPQNQASKTTFIAQETTLFTWLMIDLAVLSSACDLNVIDETMKNLQRVTPCQQPIKWLSNLQQHKIDRMSTH